MGTGELHFEEHGQGEPVLLIHGFGASVYSWRHLVPALAKCRRVIAVDLKGFGGSPKPEDDAYSIHDQVRLVSDLIRALDLSGLAIAGHSFGGGVALLLALELQSDARLRLSRLVLIDSVAYPQPLPSFISLLRTPVVGAAGVAMLPANLQVRHVLKAAYYDDALIPEEAVVEYARALDMPGGRHALLRTAAQLVPPDIEEIALRYGEIRVPTLLLWGREDEIVPLAIGDRLHGAVAGSRLEVLDRCGHIPHEESPAAAVPVVCEFLDEARPKSG
jgi:pimeloyl-ACP methyl ester carboxylesterase